jgi:hypothetical protein
LENVSIALNTITTWFIGLLFYNLLLDPAVIQFPSAALANWWLANAALVTTALTMVSVYLMDNRTLWLQRYDQQKTQLWIITTTIIMGQIFFVINYLPNLVVVKALSLVFAYYLLTSIGRAHLDGNLTWAILKKYIYLSAALLLAIIITSAWLA